MLRTLRAEATTEEGGAVTRQPRVRFVMVYVAEAHAEDEWPISSSRFNANRGPVRWGARTSQRHAVDPQRLKVTRLLW